MGEITSAKILNENNDTFLELEVVIDGVTYKDKMRRDTMTMLKPALQKQQDEIIERIGRNKLNVKCKHKQDSLLWNI
ncbi:MULTISPECIES: hypothetical protein [Bacillus]|uniref:hypothetical protein n=1 Tax=Bacillus TaxID=1386 RepID=UPI000BF0DE45|nr:hypothetical protein [Bacillus mycoides]PEK86494.1 hypothetical protein CN600_28880 [Bacillus mycoides]HDR7635525.1 hypothetical protein [Bacillus mycoides]